MSFFKNLNTLLFGENKAEAKQREQFDKVAERDNRMKDFDNFSSQALNNLSSRGIINSSVTGKALGQALSHADDKYWEDQYKLINTPYGKDKKGIAGSLIGGISKGMSGIFG